MSREIKFRAWDGEDMLTNLDSVSLEELRVGVINNNWPEDGNEQIHLKAVMQYTGLKDKNGVEIYEGDIVVSTHLDEPVTGKVVWHNATASYGVKYGEHLSNYKLKPYADIDAPFEVIGNIHSNPELLK